MMSANRVHQALDLGTTFGIPMLIYTERDESLPMTNEKES